MFKWNRQSMAPAQPDDFEMSGSVVAQLWKRQSKRGRSYWTITFGRWNAYKKKLYMSKQLYPSDLDDIIEVCYMLKKRMRK